MTAVGADSAADNPGEAPSGALWKLARPDAAAVSALTAAGIPDAAARVLAGRGMADPGSARE
ncbi:MAG TPA: hypothetical protein VFL12_13155, partial [Thermoanaerobaculia bacterium]|nr:hypothetical protein [Thermoanaerobaculia bacterium]